MKNSKRPKLKTPRKYLSWSSFDLARKNPSKWIETYLYGKRYEYKATEFGSEFARARFEGNGSKDHDIDFAMTFLPKYPKREYVMTVSVGSCVILGKFDGYDPRKGIVADDKTTKKLIQNGKPGQVWTQAKVDKFEQFTWYIYIYWKKFKRMPIFRCHWYDWETKQLKTFTTTRTLKDFLLLQSEINRVWSWIEQVSQEEYQRIIN